jgi:hypothetical protein
MDTMANRKATQMAHRMNELVEFRNMLEKLKSRNNRRKSATGRRVEDFLRELQILVIETEGLIAVGLKTKKLRAAHGTSRATMS